LFFEIIHILLFLENFPGWLNDWSKWNLIMLESIPDKTRKRKTTAWFCLHTPRESQTFEFGGTILAWHSLAACIMHMWIRVLCKIINQLHRKFLFASWFSKGAVKIISNYTQKLSNNCILYEPSLSCVMETTPHWSTKIKSSLLKGPLDKLLTLFVLHMLHISIVDFPIFFNFR